MSGKNRLFSGAFDLVGRFKDRKASVGAKTSIEIEDDTLLTPESINANIEVDPRSGNTWGGFNLKWRLGRKKHGTK